MKPVRRTQHQLSQQADDLRTARRAANVKRRIKNQAEARKTLDIIEGKTLPYDKIVRHPRDKTSRAFRQLVTDMLIERDGNHCYLCQEPFTAVRKHCIEHIIPITRGGENTPANVALACYDCNSKKATHIVSFELSSRRPIYTRAELSGGS